MKTKNNVSAIPQGYNTVTAHLVIKGAAKAIDFYKQVFSAKEVMRMEGPNGTIRHAEIIIGDSKIMLADEYPEMNVKGPESFGGSPIGIHLYVEDVDSVIQNAVKWGAKIERPITDMFYGDRIGSIVDPCGHQWSIATHIEDVSIEEMKQRAAAMGKK